MDTRTTSSLLSAIVNNNNAFTAIALYAENTYSKWLKDLPLELM